MTLNGFNQRLMHSVQGAALLLVLCFVVLTAGLMVAFFSRATTERQVSNFSAGSTKVELLADTALDLVIDDLKQEIVNHSNTSGSGTNTFFIPVSGTYAVPVRQTFLSGTLANLLRISSRSDSATRAVNASTSGTSINGRSVPLPRWNLHYLLPLKTTGTVGDTTPNASFAAPDWVIVTRSGTASGSGWSHSLADATSSNTAYAIGRYAYAIYDEGGLLDINAAGYPSSAAADQYGPKGGIAYADLTQLSLTALQIDQLVGWRNYATAQPTGTFSAFTFDNSAAARFQSWATSSSTQFLSLSGTATYNGNTDHAILNRQQLIKLLLSIGNTSAEQAQLQSALQYLGTFTREVNGPTCSGTGINTTDYNPPAIFGVKVSGTFTRADGTPAVSGEPLLKNRFPLEKLALLEKMKGVSSLTSQDKDDIARYFGLDPVSDSNGYFRHWSYPTASTVYRHGTGTSGAGGIMSLADVAAQNREPDFFELLQAGIYQGSLGKGNVRSDLLQGSMGYTLPSFSDPDAKTTLQLLRIGANIIDQWDADSYPATITYTPTGDSVYGIEDLPYIDKFLFRVTGTSANYALPYTFSCGFALWNPHQLLASNTGAYPSSFRISPLSDSGSVQNSDWYMVGVVGSDANGTRGYWNYDVANGNWSTASPYQRFGDIASGSGVIGPFSATKSDYREPALSGSLTVFTMNSFPGDTVTSGTLKWSKVMADQPQTGSNWNAALRFPFSVVYRIQYQDPSGVFRTYGTFVGQDRSDVATGFRQGLWFYFQQTTQAGWCSFPKPDPRTYRFGSGYAAIHSNPIQSLTPFYNTTVAPIFQNDPFVANTSATPNQSFSNNPYRSDLWTVNDPADSVFSGATADPATFNGNKPYYFDPDGKARPGDSIYSWSSASTSQSPLYTSGTTARPVMLNRAFRSVGELGYAFRDMPWKTLDLFSPYSADAALLDLFSLQGGQRLLAGRVNPNTRQPNVLAAVLAGATQASGTSGTGNVSPANAQAVASAVAMLSGSAPIASRQELVSRLMNQSAVGGISKLKTERESVIRALADCSNTRTWNLLIDLVAQVGKYPAAAGSLDQFLVEGERHYWLHVAIDRYTGRVVDQQLEVVSE
ncbi:MAG: hypothetical protein ACFUZC_14205 [Chthoniobacteraceae bacterium]